MEPVVQFLICFCANSRPCSLHFVTESSQPVTFLAEFIARDGFPPLLHAQFCLLLRVVVPFLDELPYGVSVDRLNDTLRDFATHLTQASPSELFVHERSPVLSILEPSVVPKAEEEEEEEKEPKVIAFPVLGSEADDPESVARLIRQIELLRSANDSIERQFSEYRKTQSVERDQLLATHNAEMATENDSNLAEITRPRAKVSELEGALDSLTVTDRRMIAELKQTVSSKEIEYAATITQLKNTQKESLATKLDALREECRSLRMEVGLFKSKQKALMDESIEDIKEQRRWTQSVVDENCQLKFRISQLLKDNSSLENEMSDLTATSEVLQTPLTQSREAFEENRRLKSENARLAERETLCLRLEVEIADLRRAVAGYGTEKSETEKDQAIARLENGQSVLELAISRLENEKSLLTATNAELENRRSALQKANGDLQNVRSELEQSISQSEKEKSVSNGAMAELENQKSELETANERPESENRQLELAKSELQERASVESQTPNDEFESEITELQKAKSDLERRASRLETEKSALQSTNAELETEKSELDTANARLENAKSELESANLRLENEKADLHKANSELESAKSALQRTRS
jgi:chromosome segregation ATPase